MGFMLKFKGTMQKKVTDAKSSPEMEAAADTVAGIAIDRSSTDPANPKMQREFTDYATDRVANVRKNYK